MADYTDFTRGYEFEEVSAGADADEVNGNGEIPNFNSVGAGLASLTGFGNARGPLRAVGHASPAWFTESTLSDAGFDIRGQKSMAFSCWCHVPDNSDGGPTLFSIHDPSSENGQAFQVYAYHTTEGGGGPIFIMWDGLTIFNGAILSHPTAPAPANNTYYYIGVSRDKVSKELRLFYGRAAGESYYVTKAGFTDGFGYDGVTGLGAGEGVHIGRYDGLAAASVIGRVDQLLFWNDRALDQTDFLRIWNDGAGVPTAELIFPEFVGSPHYHYA